MLGDALRREREKQGLTVKDIENETSIRSVYITAIEKGDYDSLPGDVYTKGFIRNYARALNMDSESLLQQFNSERNIETPIQPVDQMSKPNYYEDVPQRTVTVKSSNRDVYRSDHGTNLFSSGDDYRERTEEKSGSRAFLIFLAVLAVFLGGVYYAFSDTPSKPANKPAVKTEQVKKENTKTTEKPVAKTYDSVDVVAKCDDVCWVSVTVDGKNVFEGMMEKGKEMSWKGKDRVVVTAGNAGAMELIWNGNSLGKLGNKGQVVERVMTKDNDGRTAAKSDTQSAANTGVNADNNTVQEKKTAAPDKKDAAKTKKSN